MWTDRLNGVFEFASGFFILLHCVRLYKDKAVKGVSVIAWMFFTAWSFWNLYYYPFLNQSMSFVGSCHAALWHVIWVILAIYYIKKGKKT